MYTPKHLSKWTSDGPTAFDSADNYIGANFSDYFVAAGTNRDASVLTRSNWTRISEDLMAISDEDEEGNDSVLVVSFDHWACGWYELLLVRGSNEKALQLADEISAALSDYPVYDEDHFSMLEWDEANEYWESLSVSDRLDLIKESGNHISAFAARHSYIPAGDDNGYIQERCGDY